VNSIGVPGIDNYFPSIDGTSWKVFAGIRPIRLFAVEVDYLDLGQQGAREPSQESADPARTAREQRPPVCRAGGETRGGAKADGPRTPTLAVHLSRASRSFPGGKFFGIARRTVICGALMGRAWSTA